MKVGSFLIWAIIVGCYAVDPFEKLQISNGNGLTVWFIPFGATMTHFFFPDNTGTPVDIILGFDDPMNYRDYPIHPYFGATIGRYANRIAHGSLTLNNYVHHVPLNDNNWDTLHGGDIGYDRRVWNILSSNATTIVFQLYDGDLVEAFPGDVNVTITYHVTQANELILDQQATTSSSTIINLSLHTYWNLNGFKDNNPTILNHTLSIAASKYTPVDSHLLPTGAIDSVTNAPYLDFRDPKQIGQDIKNGTVTPNGGYDNNLVLDNPSLSQPALQASGPESGIHMEIYTTQPGLQFYTGNFLDGTIPRKSDQIFGGQNQVYEIYSGFAAETQHFPDSIHYPDWPTTILNQGEIFHQTTIYKFHH
jgi:aldose 1-epimerase